MRSTDPSKWFKSVYRLCGDGGSANQVPSSENLTKIAEKLQEAFTRPWHDLTPTMAEVQQDGLSVSSPRIPSIGQVKNVLKQLNARKATGADNIPAWVFKRFTDELAAVTHDIITASIVQNKYPTMYEHALVSRVPKVHPPEKIESDFRQISVLHVMAKILEKVQIFLNQDKLLTKSNQHAFVHGRSTLSALINISLNWFNDTDNKLHGRKSIHALFADFSKAFDLVDHSVLLNKLKQLNINTSLWPWIQSFLTDRTQQVKLPGALSTKRFCPVGVPQGSVISPLLFNVFIDDIDDAIPVNLRDRVRVCKYADDCTFYESISTNDESSMQVVLNSIHEWTTSNHMLINSKKTKDMLLTFRKSPTTPDSLHLGNCELDRVNVFKLLGVCFQDDLCWNHHIEKMTKKANKGYSNRHKRSFIPRACKLCGMQILYMCVYVNSF